MIRCQKCGCNNTDDSNFCKNCGFKLDKSVKNGAGKVKKATAFAVETTHTEIRDFVVGLCIVFLVICVILLALVGILRSQGLLQPFNRPHVIQDDSRKKDTGKPVKAAASEDVKAVKSGCSVIKDKYSNDLNIYYGLECKNSSSQQAIGWMEVKVTCRDKAGNVIDRYIETGVMTLAPGETTGMAFSGGPIKEEPETVDIDFKFDDSSKSLYPTVDDVERLDVVNAKVKKIDDTFSSVTADIENKSDKQFEFGTVYIVFKNDEGEITGGYDIYLHKVKKGKSSFSYDYMDSQIVTDNYACYGIAQN